MTTSSDHRAAARRQRYLAAAERLFAEHGFSGTSVDMLVAEVGGSKATFYTHFASKDALVVALIDEVAATINRPMPELVDGDVSLEEALTAIGIAAIRGAVSHEAAVILRICLGEYHRLPQLARTVWEHGPAVTYANFRGFLEERQRRGELSVDDPQLAAEQFIAGLVGHLQPKVAMGVAEPPDDAEIARRVASAVRAFLAAHTSRVEPDVSATG